MSRQLCRHRKRILFSKFWSVILVWYLVPYAVKPIHWQHLATGICNTQSSIQNTDLSTVRLYSSTKRGTHYETQPLDTRCYHVISLTKNTTANIYINSKIQNACLRICDIDINVWVEDLTDIFAFCQFNAMNTPFLKLRINSCLYYVIYDIINIFQGKASLACKKKRLHVSNNTILQFTQ